MLCRYLQDAQGRFCSGFVMGMTGRKTAIYLTWHRRDGSRAICSKVMGFLSEEHQICESDYGGRNTVLYSRPWDVCYRASAIVTFEAQTWHFRERNGYLLSNITSCQTRNMECQRSSRRAFPVSRIPIQQCAVTSHSQNTVRRSSALTFRHRASSILGQAFRCSTESAFYIFNQQIYFIIWYLLDRASLI